LESLLLGPSLDLFELKWTALKPPAMGMELKTQYGFRVKKQTILNLQWLLGILPRSTF